MLNEVLWSAFWVVVTIAASVGILALVFALVTPFVLLTLGLIHKETWKGDE